MRSSSLLLVPLLAGLFGCSRASEQHFPRQAAAEQGNASGGSSKGVELDGQPFDLWSGRESAAGTALVFVRSDCPISNRLAPTVRSLCEQYQSLGIDFFLVYVDSREDAARIRQHLVEYHYTCRGLRDPLHSLVLECQATVTPEAVLFNSQRQIVYQGRIDDLYANLGQARPAATTHEFADALAAVVAGRPVAEPRTRAVGCCISDLK